MAQPGEAAVLAVAEAVRAQVDVAAQRQQQLAAARLEARQKQRDEELVQVLQVRGGRRRVRRDVQALREVGRLLQEDGACAAEHARVDGHAEARGRVEAVHGRDVVRRHVGRGLEDDEARRQRAADGLSLAPLAAREAQREREAAAERRRARVQRRRRRRLRRGGRGI